MRADVYHAPAFWQKRSFLSYLLLPLSWLYTLASKLRWLITRPQQIDAPVICIGNVTLGGAGKTPTAIAIGHVLSELGIKYAYISRGYGRQKQEAQLIKVEPNTHTSLEVGDEPLLLAKQAPTYVSSSRIAAATQAIKDGAECIIMDDGFQNPSIHKDLSILVVNSNFGMGNLRIFPSGPLRESIDSALKRSDIIVHFGKHFTSCLPAHAKKKTCNATLVPTNLRDIKQKPVIAFAAIANPEKFFDNLKRNAINIVDSFSFPDHHPYSAEEIEDLKAKAKASNATLVTTTKDATRIPKALQKEIFVVETTIEWEKRERIKKMLSHKIELMT